MEKLLKNVQKSTEGNLFWVKPLEIDRSLFEKKRLKGEGSKEWLGGIIMEAFEKVDNEPERYASPFYILIPEKKWDRHTRIQELKDYAKKSGGRVTNWVEWALQQAQRISNGESWEVVFDNLVLSPNAFIILWKNRRHRVVGNARLHYAVFPLYDVDHGGYISTNKIENVVPAITLRR